MTDIQWYIQVGAGKKAGPISFERLRKIARQGKIFPSTKVRSDEAGATWAAASDVPGLFDEEPADLPTEEPTSDAALPEETSDDSVAESVAVIESEKTEANETDVQEVADEKKSEPTSVKPGAIVIDVGKISSGKTVAPKEKKKTWSGFTIDTSGKKDKEPDPSEAVVEEKKEEEKEEIEESAVPVEPKKIEPKPAESKKTDKSSVAVKIDLVGSKKKNTEESSTVVVSESELPIKATKSDQSSPAIKIDFGASRKKTEAASEVSEPKKSKRKEQKEKTSPQSVEKSRKAKKSGGGLSPLLKSTAVAAFLVGGLGATGLVALGLKEPGMPFAAILGSVVLLLGAFLGVVAWSLAGLADKITLLEKPTSKQPAEREGSPEE